jgi:hypothetical protein
MKMQASKQFTLILAKYCKIVQSPFLHNGGKAWTSVKIQYKNNVCNTTLTCTGTYNAVYVFQQ